MKAIKYKLLVATDGIHRFMDYEIEEIYIPEKDIVFNEEGFCFRSKNRNSGNMELSIEIADEFVSTLEVFLEYKRITKSGISHYFKNFTKCSCCGSDIGPTIIKLFIDSEKKKQVCPSCWEHECKIKFSRGIVENQQELGEKLKQ
jgi:hypothetical protein